MALDILVVDDEADIRELISDVLQDAGYNTRHAADSDSTLKAVAERVPSAIIMDIWLQGSELDGLGVLELLQKKHPLIPIIMISGHGTIETAVTAMKMGAYDFIEKPFAEDRLLMMISRAIEAAQLKRENQELRMLAGPESELIGNSQVINTVRQAIDKVAPTKSRVLITGPAGCGKEVVARLIHQKSRRANGRFVHVNAASLSPDRLESELFGVEDKRLGGGAEKIGLFEQAHGGTLFIDEVADMPIETQGKILRVLQEQAFTRVGGTRRVETDVRVIASSNRNLQKEMELGNFREDLYYRLNVVPVKVPPLKERRSDIPMFCDFFLRRMAKVSGLPERRLAEDAMAALQSYHWPGNVRQLRNLMEWLLIMTPGAGRDAIHSSALPSDLFDDSPALVKPELNADIMSLPLRDARELFERQYLQAQINRFGGNISRTSSFIGMERSALHRKLKSLGVKSFEKAA